MPSWNEKPHVVPSINVNLASCSRHHLPLHCEESQHHVLPGTGNLARCEAPPVLVPLPLEPWRSVTMKVRHGECICPPSHFEIMRHYDGHAHQDCPARPVEVTCFIRGTTWPESEVADVQRQGSINAFLFESEEARLAVLAACRDLWALVKALVMGGNHDPENHPYEARALFKQRDAVFSALCEMARTEVATLAAQERVVNLLDSKRVTFRQTEEAARPSAKALEVYVERLIEQVVVLP